ncbi:hypothetical protein VN97_g7117 [Penicillium thymicola]|uniref:Uncharacterized protein n=1 Tax=Penicillium thymicola TaxID=293382 RepID=A0AAI9TGZ1_PENTH|nr:hypothetical protein VN97_g7117 [Penicillium thymicola]
MDDCHEIRNMRTRGIDAENDRLSTRNFSRPLTAYIPPCNTTILLTYFTQPTNFLYLNQNAIKLNTLKLSI